MERGYTVHLYDTAASRRPPESGHDAAGLGEWGITGLPRLQINKLVKE